MSEFPTIKFLTSLGVLKYTPLILDSGGTSLIRVQEVREGQGACLEPRAGAGQMKAVPTPQLLRPGLGLRVEGCGLRVER